MLQVFQQIANWSTKPRKMPGIVIGWIGFYPDLESVAPEVQEHEPLIVASSSVPLR